MRTDATSPAGITTHSAAVLVAAEYVESDHQQVIEAQHLQPGDVLVTPGFVSLAITRVRQYREHRLVAAEYDCTAGVGTRTLIDTERVAIAPRKIAEVH